MRRIALVAHWDWVLFNYWLRLARRLQALGCDVTMICPRGEYVERLKEAGFACRDWPVIRRGLNPFREWWALRHLAWTYRACRFDAVHHFTIKPALYGTLAARLSRVPVIFNMFSGLGYIFSNTPRARIIRAVVIPALRLALRSANIFTQFETPEDRERFLRRGLVRGERSGVVPGSVATDAFVPGSRANGHEPPVVLMGGRLLWLKGVRELMDAARALKSRGIAARVQVAGSPDQGNPDSIPASVLRQWREEGVAEFLDMSQLLRDASIAALPTSYNEGVPRFLLEAAAAGLPLVATDLPGCGTIVRDRENGFIVPRGNVPALTEALATLLADPELRDRMGRVSRQIAVEEFDDNRVLERYVTLYLQHGLIVSA